MNWMSFALLPFETAPGGSGEGGSGGTGTGVADPPATTPQVGAPGTQVEPAAGATVPASEAQEARREAQNLRTRLREAEKERDDLKASQLSAEEKVVKERDDLQVKVSSLEAENKRLQIMALAPKAGIVDPEAAAALLRTEGLDLSDNAVVEKALRDLVKEKPYLAGSVPGGGDGGAGDGSGGGKEDMNQLIRRAAGRES